MVSVIVKDMQEVTGEIVQVAYANGGYNGAVTARESLVIVKCPADAAGFMLRSKCWIVEHSFAWKARLDRLVKDYERLPETVAGLHFCVFAILMLARAATQAISP